MKWRKYLKGLGIGAGIAFLLLVTHRAAPRKAVENEQMQGVWLTNMGITSVLTGKTAIVWFYGRVFWGLAHRKN